MENGSSIDDRDIAQGAQDRMQATYAMWHCRTECHPSVIVTCHVTNPALRLIEISVQNYGGLAHYKSTVTSPHYVPHPTPK
jgi:hypothetical protein